jgi:hypothetical protein
MSKILKTIGIFVSIMLLFMFLSSVNFIPNSFFSSGNVTIPTIVKVVRNATTGTILAPALKRDPTRGNATKAGINVMHPTNAKRIVEIRIFDSKAR